MQNKSFIEKTDHWVLASLLQGRFRELALTRAVSHLQEAEKDGDEEITHIWRDVVDTLRTA